MSTSRRLLIAAPLAAAVAVAAGCAVYAPPPGPPAPRVSAAVSLFWDDLAPFGDWVWIEVHGWVWIPAAVPSGWRPYTHGRWIYTTHGWTWASDWRWGWGPFHYGRWLWHPPHGWVWLPGDVWAPAWVAWRHGPGWVGWAPLPPGARWEVGIGLELGDVEIELGWWSFVPDRHFTDHRLRHRIVPGDRDRELVRITREVTRYQPSDRGVVDRSVPVEEIEGATRRAVPRLRIEAVDGPPRRGARVDGDRLRVYRPAPSAAPGASGGSGATAGDRGASRSGEKKDAGKGSDRGASRTRPPTPPGER